MGPLKRVRLRRILLPALLAVARETWLKPKLAQPAVTEAAGSSQLVHSYYKFVLIATFKPENVTYMLPSAR
jgi:hypothetical protein